MSTAWPYRFVGWTKTMAHPSDDRHAMIGRCEQVFVNNYPLHHVLDRAALSRGTFYVDIAAKRLCLWDRGNRDVAAKGRCLVEASSRSQLWQSQGDYVHVRGIRFRYAANRAQQAAASFRGKGSVVEDCVFEKSSFIGNRGNGVWFDIGNEECVVRNCLIAENEHAGIFYEISYSLHAHDNVIVGNGFGARFGAWGANGGISLSSSPNCVIERNVLIGNREVFQFREQNRSTPLIDGTKGVKIWNHDNIIRNNVLAYNQDLQVGGWFDVTDARHWPENSPRRTPATTAGAPEDDMAAKYRDRDGKTSAPTGLERLALVLDGNLYGIGATQGLFQWGCSWRDHARYSDLAELSAELGFEKTGRVAALVFGDYLTRDFRVPADSPALRMGCYPKGDIPGVTLGVLPQ